MIEWIKVRYDCTITQTQELYNEKVEKIKGHYEKSVNFVAFVTSSKKSVVLIVNIWNYVFWKFV